MNSQELAGMDFVLAAVVQATSLSLFLQSEVEAVRLRNRFVLLQLYSEPHGNAFRLVPYSIYGEIQLSSNPCYTSRFTCSMSSSFSH
jgi:hypothetical protein